MKMRRLFIEPLDVLMFRCERPFIARESYIAKLGIISPLTFEGAIKSKIFSDFCSKRNYSPSIFQRKKKANETIMDLQASLNKLQKTVKNLIEKDEELKDYLELLGYTPLNYQSKLKVLGVFFAKKDELKEHFPMPMDIVRKDVEKEARNPIKIRPSMKIKLNKELSAVLPSEYSKIKKIEGLIEIEELKRYLWGEIPRVKEEKEKPYIEEVRIGIKIKGGTKTTVTGHLYMAEFMRLRENWGFIIWYDVEDGFPINISNGIIRLGGEGKGAVYRKVNDIDLNGKLDFPELINVINREKKFKLYLASPSYLKGCMPPLEILKKTLGVNSLSLISALPAKPIYMGGYDFAMNIEKPLRRWVNAGAVYYYKFEGKIHDNLSLPLKFFDGNVDMRCIFLGRW